jgi:hypothetical protein
MYIYTYHQLVYAHNTYDDEPPIIFLQWASFVCCLLADV